MSRIARILLQLNSSSICVVAAAILGIVFGCTYFCYNHREQLSVYDSDPDKRFIMLNGEVVDTQNDVETCLDDTVPIKLIKFYLMFCFFLVHSHTQVGYYVYLAFRKSSFCRKLFPI